MEEYNVIGLMSGTSMDGLDIALCNFRKAEARWEYTIVAAETLPYSAELEKRLREAASLSVTDFFLLHNEYGRFMGNAVKNFLQKRNLNAGLIASHGHTILHQPHKHLTLQIGSGASLLAESGIETVCDFRSVDVALGGQGAPLVPVGDKMLFGEYDFCLNLGGIANISYENRGQRIAFDICACNIVLNHYAALMGFAYDDKGSAAASGKVNRELLQELNGIAFCKQMPPKSLGIEYIREAYFPILEKYDIPNADVLASLCEHIAMQIGNIVHSVQKEDKTRMLITGGGAFNQFLMNRIAFHCETEIIPADEDTIKFKEALIFAFLGLLRKRNEINCLQSVTASSMNHTAACIYTLR